MTNKKEVEVTQEQDEQQAEIEDRRKKKALEANVEKKAREATESMVELLLQGTMKHAASMEAGEPIKLDIDLPGHEGEWVMFLGKGWTFKDIRLYEESIGAASLSQVVSSKIVDWKIKVDGTLIPFKPKKLREQFQSEDLPEDDDGRATLLMRMQSAEREAFDDLSSAVVTFVWAAYRQAYNLAGSLSPN